VTIVGLIGFSEDRNSSHATGAKDAPEKIRQALHNPATNTWSELGCDVHSNIFSYGDVSAADPTQVSMIETVRPAITNMMKKKQYVPLILGGDHSISTATCAVVASVVGPLKIVQFDAHPNLYHNFEDNRCSHASTMARLCEDKDTCLGLTSIGVRCFNGHQRQQAAKFGVNLIEARDFPARGSDIREQLSEWILPTDKVYISFDMGVLDPSCAPGVSHPEPGGLTTRQAVDAIHCIPGRIVGADIVEYNPSRDLQNLTATTAAKILKEIAGKIMTQPEIPH
ncbi:unnamed protein product, partial [Ectocarpus fasciculatus]